MTDKKLTKEQAQALYDQLHRAMKSKLGSASDPRQSTDQPSPKKTDLKTESTTAAATQAVGKSAYARAKPQNQNQDQGKAPQFPMPVSKSGRFAGRLSPGVRLNGVTINGYNLALLVLAFLGCAKITLSAIEVVGLDRVEDARAAVNRVSMGVQMSRDQQTKESAMKDSQPKERWTKEEAKILTALDARRVELEERGGRLEKREGEFAAKERELAIRLTELKEISEKLKIEREKGDKQRNTQLEQLANVYGSMNPPEAAHLLEQLDIQVALSLVERMPEKRMAQILSLMNAQRALELTNLLTHRPG
jgi:flagellar motility protein MotE (MotC chaperone)